jgi:hypothetical protein
VATEPVGFASRVRHAIYQHFVQTASAPSVDELSSVTQISARDVEEALMRLQAAHVIALAPGSTNIWMAPPFSSVPTAFPVLAGGLRYWANCAWDAFGIASLIGITSETQTQCADCGQSIALRISAEGILEPQSALIHFLVPPKRFWDNLGFT